jgi:hypothetical protein
VQRLAREQVGILVRQRPLDLECLLQIFRQALLGALGHAVQVTLGVVVLGDRDFHFGVERQVVEIRRGLKDRGDVGVAQPVVLDVEKSDAAADVGDLVGKPAPGRGITRPGRREIDDGHVVESELAGRWKHRRLLRSGCRFLVCRTL